MDIDAIISYLPLYKDALILTVKIGIQGVILAFLLGLICAVIMHLRIPALRQLIAFYIELFRNTPLLVQLFFLYFALPKVGLQISPQICDTLGLGMGEDYK